MKYRTLFKHPSRVGWVMEAAPGGGFHGWPAHSRPSINLKHIDGPLLSMRNGELHWLTWRERILLWLGRVDAEALERKYRPHLSQDPIDGEDG